MRSRADVYKRQALARSVLWLALWDMTRDGELPARQFIDTSLAALATEHESTTFRYALAQVSTTAWHYTCLLYTSRCV